MHGLQVVCVCDVNSRAHRGGIVIYKYSYLVLLGCVLVQYREYILYFLHVGGRFGTPARAHRPQSVRPEIFSRKE